MMPNDQSNQLLADISCFDQLVIYLRDEMDWPIGLGDFEDLTFEYTPEELGIVAEKAAKIQEIRRLRPLVPNQPWGIFFIKFEPKSLPVLALRRILNQVVLKKRASDVQSDRQAWAIDDLLFISNYHAFGERRRIAFAHFTNPPDGIGLPNLKVLDWDNLDTSLHLSDVADKLTHDLAWPDESEDVDVWRERWRGAFTLRHREIITTSKELSVQLAELARNIRNCIRDALAIETEKGPLTELMVVLRAILVHDLDADGFADMYAQTIAYGLLSRRIADPHRRAADDFTAHIRTNSFLRELMETFFEAGERRGKISINFDELGISELIRLLDEADMEAVVRDFGDRNPQEDPVIHFYELFLKEYDKEKQIERGVFYTPRPVVSRIVRSVNELLRTEFGFADGLADTTTWGEMAKRNANLKVPKGVSPDDDFIQILDPATGTGTFLVEVIDLIYKTLESKWQAQGHGREKIKILWNEYVPKHLLSRLYGYEIMMAPYAIAHLKVGLKLYETGYRFRNADCAHIYLTDALDSAQDVSPFFEFSAPSLASEAKKVGKIKECKHFTVVIGNPPYKGDSINRGEWISSLLKIYKQEPGGGKLSERNSKGINDDYVKFIRCGQHYIDRSGKGILAYINNHSFLDAPTFRGVRWSLLQTFGKIYIINLHGNANKKEVAPDGSVDENVFAIKQGVSINFFVKSNEGSGKDSATVFYYDLYGDQQSKYEFLLNKGFGAIDFVELGLKANQYYFVSRDYELADEYNKGFSIRELFRSHSLGIATSRDAFTIYYTPKELRDSIFRFLAMDDETAREYFNLGPDVKEWKIHLAREDLENHVCGNGNDQPVSISWRPFDIRYTYYTGKSKGFHCRPRKIMRHFAQGGNIGLIACRNNRDESHTYFLSNTIADKSLISSLDNCNVFPLYLYSDLTENGGGGGGQIREPNMSPNIIKNIAVMLNFHFVSEHDGDNGTFSPIDLFDYIYAVLYSPFYRERYKGFLRADFPCVPYPENRKQFRELAALGGQLRSFHLFENDALDDLITSYPEKGGNQVVKVEGKLEKGKVYINERQYFGGVPDVVWGFQIGGYRPAQKWLKDREGRALSHDDIVHYQKIIVALFETKKLMGKIDRIIIESNNRIKPGK